MYCVLHSDFRPTHYDSPTALAVGGDGDIGVLAGGGGDKRRGGDFEGA